MESNKFSVLFHTDGYGKFYYSCFLCLALWCAISGLCQAAVSKPRIAIINEKAFHLEVVGGLIQVLSPYIDTTTIYLHPLNFRERTFDFGFMDLLKEYPGRMRGLSSLSFPQFDVAIFVSPEYRVDYVREVIQRMQPRAVVMLIHNGDAPGVVHLPGLHSNTHFMTLAPHVAKFVNNRLNMTTVDWMLPLRPMQPVRPCDVVQDLPKCLSGFAIQGNMDSRRRNYTEIWRQLEARLNTSAELKRDSRFMVNVVGSGSPSKLEVPPRLAQRIAPHANLKFPEFYELIHHNFALIPTLASEAYFDRKFSSTLITSMVTGVPVIVNYRFLKSYTFLNQSHVYMQWNKEETMDSALRILQLSAEELAATRIALHSLRDSLNSRAAQQLQAIITAAMNAPATPQ
mmetsp:Transcript_40261/g.89407  ORF Transcript_40261/g.89407 Transcript_40261/m.89407 type:complete len:399 (+) Transcript_40261:273-1469(+)